MRIDKGIHRLSALAVLLIALSGFPQSSRADTADNDELQRAKTLTDAENGSGILTLEPAVIARAKSAISRKNQTLTLRLRSGKIVELSDTLPCKGLDPPKTCADHRAIAYHRAYGLFIICKSLYDDRDYVLVDDSSGALTTLKNFPVLAPSGNLILVSIENDAEFGFGLQIWRRTNHKFNLEWSGSPYYAGGYITYRVAHFAEDRIEMRAIIGATLTRPASAKNFVLTRAKGGWAAKTIK